MESFNGKLRDECLNPSWFWNLFDTERKISAWKIGYNSRRPHMKQSKVRPKRSRASERLCDRQSLCLCGASPDVTGAKDFDVFSIDFQ